MGTFYRDAVLADAPIRYWRFDDGSGSVATDHSGNDAHGEYRGGVTLGLDSPTNDDGAGAIGLDGIDGHVFLAGPVDLDFRMADPYTWEAWAWWAGPDNIGSVFARGAGGAGDRQYQCLLGTSVDPETIRFNVGGSTGADLPDYPIGSWHHIVCRNVPDGTNSTRTIWVDGVLVFTHTSNADSSQAVDVLAGARRDSINEGLAHILEGRLAELAVYDHALDETRIRAHFDAASFEAGEPVNPLPTFAKLGTKLSTPAWVPSGEEIFYPRLIDNDALRANLPNLPASRFSVLFSTDHASSDTGRIGRADFDTIEGAWTDSGAAVHEAGNQREAPHPVYDPTNNRINVYVHDNTSTGIPNGSQAARLLTTTDLQTFTDQGQILEVGNHTGYGGYKLIDGTFRGIHNLTSTNENQMIAVSESADGESFALLDRMHRGQQHVMGIGHRHSIPSMFLRDGQWYYVCRRLDMPSPSASIPIVAIPVSDDWTRPVGPMQTLLTEGAAADDDGRHLQEPAIYDIDGTLYLLYAGRDGNGGQHILIAKEDGGEAPATALEWPITEDGELERDTAIQTDEDYDATGADDLPAWLETQAADGVDNSSHVVGQHYELRTGSGSQQTLALLGPATDWSEHETVEWTIRGVTMSGEAEDQSRLTLGMFDANDGALVRWSNVGDEVWGELAVRDAGVEQAFRTEYIGFHESGNSLRGFNRAAGYDLTVRIHDHGKRLTLLIDGSVAYHRDITDLASWPASLRPRIEIATRGTHPQIWLRFEGVAVRSFEGEEANPRRAIATVRLVTPHEATVQLKTPRAAEATLR